MTHHSVEPPKTEPTKSEAVKSEPLKSLSIWYLVAACMGMGSGALEFFKGAPQKPIPAMAVGAVTMLGVVVFQPIGAQIQKWYTEHVTTKGEDVRKFGPGGFRERYLAHLRQRHRVFDVKGFSTQGPFSLELQKVFVDLQVVPQASHKTSTDPLRVRDQLPSGRKSVWAYLKSGKMELPHLAIIGAPGSGKTTLLKHVALTLAAEKKRWTNADMPNLVPILLFLRDHVEAIKGNDKYTLAQAVLDALTRFQGPTAPPDWFDREIVAGRCIVLLDGLDEVADAETRKKVVAWVETQVQAHGNNPFLLTSRPGGYKDNPIVGFNVVEVLPFTREQQQTFVENWYFANEAMSQQKDDEGVRLAAREGSKDLLGKIKQNNTISELAVNPLLLTLIATVHRYRSSLPGRRVELYGEICEVFLGKRRAAIGLSEKLTSLQKQRVLQPLAYEMMCRNTRTLAFDDMLPILEKPLMQVIMVRPAEDCKEALRTFLTELEHGSGLILERESGVYGFSHLTFQEYMAAVYIQERASELEAGLAVRVSDPWWHETIRLYCAKALDASFIVAACFNDSADGADFALGYECIDEAVSVRPDLRITCDLMLHRYADDPNPEKWIMAATTLLTLRIRRMVKLDYDRYVDRGLISHVEYQLFLDEMRGEGQFYQPDHWTEYKFRSGQGRSLAVGVRPSDAVAFCDWLTAREGSEWCYRLPKPGELDNDPVQEEIPIGTYAGFWTKDPSGAIFVPVGKEAPRFELARLKTYFTRDLNRDHTHAFAGAHHLAHDLNYGLTLAGARDHDLNHDLASALALAIEGALALNGALALAGARDLACALDLKRAYDRAWTDDHEHALTHARERARTGVHDLAYDLSGALDLAFTRNLDSDSDLDCVRTFAKDFAYALDHALNLARASANDRDLAIASALARARTRTLALANALGHAHTSAHPRDRALDLVCTFAYDRVLHRVSDLDRNHSSALDLDRVLDCVSKLTRVSNLALVLNYLSKFTVDLTMLAERRNGRAPAFEGIRIVRERTHPSE